MAYDKNKSSIDIRRKILILVIYIIIAKINNNSNETSIEREKFREYIKISKRFKICKSVEYSTIQEEDV